MLKKSSIMTVLTQSQQEIVDADRRIWPDELAFSVEDFETRLGTIQSDLFRKGLTGALIFDPENMYWLTGYQTIGYFTFQAMYVPLKGWPTVITRVVNRDMALALPTIADAVPIFDTHDHIGELSKFLNTNANRGLIGLETTSRALNVQDHTRLTSLTESGFVDWDGVIERQRMVKTKAQLDRMRSAARAVEAGMDAALKTIAPGNTDNDLAAALYHGSIAAGSEYCGHPPMVVTGPRSELCFALWKRNTIQTGDVVLLEGAGCIDRYHAMMSRSAIVGKPTDDHMSTANALIEVLETAIDNIKPGLTSGEIDHLCRSKVEAKGLGKYFKSRTAYGIGIGFPPNWAEGHIYAIRPNDPLVIEPNMTFHIIPTMFRDGFGMAISDSVRVTDTGCEVLTNYPRELVVVD